MVNLIDSTVICKEYVQIAYGWDENKMVYFGYNPLDKWYPLDKKAESEDDVKDIVRDFFYQKFKNDKHDKP